MSPDYAIEGSDRLVKIRMMLSETLDGRVAS